MKLISISISIFKESKQIDQEHFYKEQVQFWAIIWNDVDDNDELIDINGIKTISIA